MRFFLILLILFFSKISFSEILKPNPILLPEEVISIQLIALQNNNIPYKNAGIEQTWEFAHPSNRIFTGPLEKFTTMMYSPSYFIMLDHKEHNITLLKQKNTIAYFFVELEDQEGNLYRFQWIVEKVNIKGEFEKCWMTTSVSKPMLLEKSVSEEYRCVVIVGFQGFVFL